MENSTYELVWSKYLLQELGFHYPNYMIFKCDNQAAIYIANNPIFHENEAHKD